MEFKKNPLKNFTVIPVNVN